MNEKRQQEVVMQPSAGVMVGLNNKPPSFIHIASKPLQTFGLVIVVG
ncbi:hypothetical protein [Paenibacillus sp. 598K]|nr:hypothetical protein [Paenibacillus sp. 598K]